MTAPLARTAAVALRGLAEARRAHAALLSQRPAALYSEVDAAAIRATRMRREAVMALEGLRDALGEGPHREQAAGQAKGIAAHSAASLDVWATAWDAWAEAQP